METGRRGRSIVQKYRGSASVVRPSATAEA
jgi:hypothetical protein